MTVLSVLFFYSVGFVAGLIATNMFKGQKPMTDKPVTLQIDDQKYILAAAMFLMDLVDRLPGFRDVRLGIAVHKDLDSLKAMSPEEIEANSVSVPDLVLKLARMCEVESVHAPDGTKHNLRAH